jgi:hypothetical protein
MSAGAAISTPLFRVLIASGFHQLVPVNCSVKDSPIVRFIVKVTVVVHGPWLICMNCRMGDRASSAVFHAVPY